MRIFRAIIAGILGGAALFFLPFFILRFFLFILFIGFAIRLVIGIGFRGRGFRGRGFNPVFADKIRSMSDEEYNQFKQKFTAGCARNHWSDNRFATDATTEKQTL